MVLNRAATAAGKREGVPLGRQHGHALSIPVAAGILTRDIIFRFSPDWTVRCRTYGDY